MATGETDRGVMRCETRDVAAEVEFPPVIALLGPTAVGKSRHALTLCRQFGGVILSADSRQVYRYLDICTAKPTPEERAAVPHFMIDVVEPIETYTARRYADEALRVLRAAASRGAPVFVVGGTGFYVSVLLDGRETPPVAPDESLRRSLREEAGSLGIPALHERLAGLDPSSAERIHPNNLPRIIRALEINEKLGGPVPVERAVKRVPALYLGLHLDRVKLHATADRRVDEQMRRGLVQETETLLRMGYDRALPALDGLGYRQVMQYLRGEVDLTTAVERYKIATHQYIRRQMTWFRREQRVEWVEADSSAPEMLRERVERYLATAWGRVS